MPQAQTVLTTVAGRDNTLKRRVMERRPFANLIAFYGVIEKSDVTGRLFDGGRAAAG